MKPSNGHGFTLIELLIVVAILAILAAIAIPQYTTYKRRAYNASANSDMQNVRTMEEAMFAEAQDYGSALVATLSITLTGATVGTNQTVNITRGVFAGAKTLTVNGRNVTYVAATKHTNGDSMFGTETDMQSIYRKAMNAGAALTAADIPSATLGVDLTSPWEPVD